MKKIIICLLLIYVPVLVHGQVVINEIMYNSPGADNDWVEIYNSGSSPVAIVTGSANGSWRFVDTGSHILTLVSGVATLAPGDYSIITNDPDKFQAEATSFAGNLFKSSFSLTNTSNTISLKDGSGTITDPAVSYSSTQGASGDGNSLQRLPDGSWIAAIPTPGLVNATTAYIPPVDSTTTDQTATTTPETTPAPTSSGGGGGISTHSSQADLSNVEIKAPSVSAGRKRYATVGMPVAFDAWAKDNASVAGNFTWSFGDGSSVAGIKVLHTYLFPGLYNVVLNANFNGQEAVSRTVVQVLTPEITIKQIDNVAGFVELTNNSAFETNLFGWNLGCDNNSFVFPIDTIIGAKDSVKIPLVVTKCVASTTAWSLAGQGGRVLAQYQAPTILVNSAEREQTIASIKQKINFITAELAKIKTQSNFAGPEGNLVAKTETVVLPDNQIATIASSAPEINPTSQTAGVIVLDQDPLPANKSFFARIKSWFAR